MASMYGGSKSSGGGGRRKSSSMYGGGGGGSSTKKQDISGGITGGSGGGGGLIGAISRSPLGKALEILDTPRAGVLALARQMPLAQVVNASTGKGARIDFGKIAREIEKHEGVGDLLEGDSALAGLPMNAKRGIGFVGDVASDPLTFVTLGAGTAATGAARGTGAVSRSIGRKATAARLAKEGLEDEALRVARGGISEASTDALRQVGVQQGIGARIPFTSIGAQLPGTEGVSRAIGQSIGRPLTEKLANTPLMAKAFGGRTGQAANEIDANPLQRVLLSDADIQARADREGWQSTRERTLDEIYREYGQRVDGSEVLRVAEGGASSADPLVNEAAALVRGLFDEAVESAEKIAGRKIGRIRNYVPHKQAVEYLAATKGKGRGRTKASAERQRRIKAGDKWFGEKLEYGTIDEMNEIASRHLDLPINKVGEAIQMFVDNPWSLAQAYIRDMGTFVERGNFAKRLGAIVPDLERIPTKEAKKAGKKAANLEEVLAKLGLQAEDLAAQADPLRGEADVIAREAGDIRTAAEDVAREADVHATKASKIEDRIAYQERAAEAARIEADKFARAAEEAQARVDATRPKPKAQPKPSASDGVRYRVLVKELDKNEALITRVQQFRSRAANAGDAEAANAAQVRLEQLTEERRAMILEAEELRTKVRPEAPEPEFDVAAAEKIVADEADSFAHEEALRNAEAAERIARENAEKAEELARDVENSKGRARAKRMTEGEYRERARVLFEEADARLSQGDELFAEIARLDGMRNKVLADLGNTQFDYQNFQRLANETKTRSTARSLMERGLVKLADGRFSEPWVADAIKAMDDIWTPRRMNEAARIFNMFTSRFKAWALLSPGYHARNTYSIIWANQFDGVRYSDYTITRKVESAFKKESLSGVPKGERAWFEAWMAKGGLSASHVRDISDIIDQGHAGTIHRVGEGNWKPWSMENKLLVANKQAMAWIERHGRGALFRRVFLETGGDADAAWAAVVKNHFDYGNLSRAEEQVRRYVIPFYTWTRFNFPLQLERMMTHPGRFNAFTHAKRNIERGSEEDPEVPGYYGDLLAVRLPFKRDGRNVYATPDLPFVGLNKVLDPSQAMSSLNPAIKVPFESITNTSLFEQRPFSQTMREAPDVWIPVLQVLRLAKGKMGLPRVYESADGQLMMSEKEANKIQGMIPVLGRLRRLVPSEEKYQERVQASWISFMFGLGLRTLDEATLEGMRLGKERSADNEERRRKQLSGGG